MYPRFRGGNHPGVLTSMDGCIGTNRQLERVNGRRENTPVPTMILGRESWRDFRMLTKENTSSFRLNAKSFSAADPHDITDDELTS
jgi:hypothetical protein